MYNIDLFLNASIPFQIAIPTCLYSTLLTTQYTLDQVYPGTIPVINHSLVSSSVLSLKYTLSLSAFPYSAIHGAQIEVTFDSSIRLQRAMDMSLLS